MNLKLKSAILRIFKNRFVTLISLIAIISSTGYYLWLRQTPAYIQSSCHKSAIKKAVQEFSATPAVSNEFIEDRYRVYYHECIESKGYQVINFDSGELVDFEYAG